MSIKEHLGRYQTMYAVAAAMVAMLGGSVVVELPADKKVKVLELQVSQNIQQQNVYHEQQEIQTIQWRLNYLSNEINRITQIPHYLGRPLTPEETWQIEQFREEWRLLQLRLEQIRSKR